MRSPAGFIRVLHEQLYPSRVRSAVDPRCFAALFWPLCLAISNIAALPLQLFPSCIFCMISHHILAAPIKLCAFFPGWSIPATFSVMVLYSSNCILFFLLDRVVMRARSSVVLSCISTYGFFSAVFWFCNSLYYSVC